MECQLHSASQRGMRSRGSSRGMQTKSIGAAAWGLQGAKEERRVHALQCACPMTAAMSLPGADAMEAHVLAQIISKLSLPTPQVGQVHVSGISSKGVPGAIPLSGSPTAGSYTQSHGVHFHLLMQVPLHRKIMGSGRLGQCVSFFVQYSISLRRRLTSRLYLTDPRTSAVRESRTRADSQRVALVPPGAGTQRRGIVEEREHGAHRRTRLWL